MQTIRATFGSASGSVAANRQWSGDRGRRKGSPAARHPQHLGIRSPLAARRAHTVPVAGRRRCRARKLAHRGPTPCRSSPDAARAEGIRHRVGPTACQAPTELRPLPGSWLYSAASRYDDLGGDLGGCSRTPLGQGPGPDRFDHLVSTPYTGPLLGLSQRGDLKERCREQRDGMRVCGQVSGDDGDMSRSIAPCGKNEMAPAACEGGSPTI